MMFNTWMMILYNKATTRRYMWSTRHAKTLKTKLKVKPIHWRKISQAQRIKEIKTRDGFKTTRKLFLLNYSPWLWCTLRVASVDFLYWKISERVRNDFRFIFIFINDDCDKSSMKERKQKEEICVRTSDDVWQNDKTSTRRKFNVQQVIFGCAMFYVIFH